MTLSRALRILATVAIIALLVVFATKVDWGKTWDDIRHAALGPLLLAAGLNLLSFWLKAVRWWVFLRPVGVRSLWLATQAEFVGAALNNALVANAGEGARVIFVSQRTKVPSARILATLALERYFDLMGYVVIMVFAVFLLPMPRAIEFWRWWSVFALVAMIGIIAFLARPRGAPATVPIVSTHRPGALAAIKRYLSHFGESVRELSSIPRFMIALVLSLAAWACLIGTYGYSASALHSPLSPTANVAVTLAVSVGFLLRFTPGNVGVFQLAYAAIATQFGMDKETAVAVALFIQTIQIIPITLLGFAMAPQFVLHRGQAGDATQGQLVE